MPIGKITDLKRRGTPTVETRDRLLQLVDRFVQQNSQGLGLAFDVVWNNQFGLTPEQACAALGNKGEKAYDFFMALRALVEDISGEDFSSEKAFPSGYSGITKNGDGTISPTVAP